MPSIERMLTYARSKHRKVRYSMAYPQRLGPYYMDCSSFVYYSLRAGGFISQSHPIGNTESLYRLKGSVLEEIYNYENIKSGDIFIRGREGYSQGAGGHTGIFLRKGEIIHCNASNNTVSINNEGSFIRYFLDCKRSDKERYFRPIVNKNIGANKRKVARVRAATYVRVRPDKNSKSVASYYPGQTIIYDSIVKANGYYWLSYIGTTSGKRRYVAYKNYNGNQWIDL